MINEYEIACVKKSMLLEVNKGLVTIFFSCNKTGDGSVYSDDILNLDAVSVSKF